VVAFLKSKDEFFSKYKSFEAAATTQSGSKIKVFRCDPSGENTDSKLISHLEQNGTARELTDPATPELNGLAERKGGILVTMARCMLKHANMPDRFWSEAVAMACYISNRIPTAALGSVTPEELWTGKRSSLDNIHVFGCRAHSLIQGHRKKFDSKSLLCIYLGPSGISPGHRLYNLKTNKVIISRNVTFDESTLGFPSDEVTVSLRSPPPPAPTIPPVLAQPPQQDIGLDQTFDEIDQQPSFDRQHLDKSLNIEEVNADLEDNEHGELNQQQRSPSPLLVPSPTYVEVPHYLHSPTASQSPSNSAQHSPSSSPQPSPTNSPTHSPPSSPVQSRPSQSSASHRSSQQLPQPSRMVTRSTTGTTRAVKHLILDEYYSSVAIMNEPLTYKEALNGTDAPQWLEAMQCEFNSLLQNKTWDLVPLPSGQRAIPTRWVYRIKQLADGSIDKYKARFVAKGYSQKQGIDYNETFSPVGKFTSLRCILAIAVYEDLELHNMDVDTAFLYGELSDNIYVTQPEGFIDHSHPSFVCKLKKGLYGLKQSPRVWHDTIDTFLQNNGYKKIFADPCIYILQTSEGKAIIFLYVDDLLIAATVPLLRATKQILQSRFNMKDLGEVHSILGMEVIRNRKSGTLILRQSGYLRDVLYQFNMSNSKPVATPLDSTKNVAVSQTCASDIPFRQAVGRLLYAASNTRPDIAFGVSFASRFLSCYNEQHWSLVKRILRYIHGSLSHGLTFDRNVKNPMTLVGYSDSDWGGDMQDRSSTSAYLFMFCGTSISWASKKQSTIALSSTEAEYVAASLATTEAVWLRSLLHDLGYPQLEATTIFEDNQSCIALAKNPVFHTRTKHLDIKAHFVRQKVQTNEISLQYCSTEDMVADMLTKPLAKTKLHKLRASAGLLPYQT
jgi:hypothetical protein